MLDTVMCGTGIGIGIDGNVIPFTIGINSGSSVDGTASLPIACSGGTTQFAMLTTIPMLDPARTMGSAPFVAPLVFLFYLSDS